MIEAINSVIANAPLLRGNAEQGSNLQAVSRDIAIEETSAEFVQAPFVSPYISVNTNYNKAVLQIRDSDTGDVLRQFPSESALEARQLAERTQRFQESLTQLQASGGRDIEPSQLVQVDAAPAQTRVSETPSNIGGVSVASSQIASRALSTSAGVSGQAAVSSVNITT